MLGGDKIHNNSKLKKGIFKFFFSNFRNAENSETL